MYLGDRERPPLSEKFVDCVKGDDRGGAPQVSQAKKGKDGTMLPEKARNAIKYRLEILINTIFSIESMNGKFPRMKLSKKARLICFTAKFQVGSKAAAMRRLG
jgi:hypothetical protein